MKKQKLSLKSISGILTRDEMKTIMAGSNDGCGMCMTQSGTGSGSQQISSYCSFSSGYSCICGNSGNFC